MNVQNDGYIRVRLRAAQADSPRAATCAWASAAAPRQSHRGSKRATLDVDGEVEAASTVPQFCCRPETEKLRHVRPLCASWVNKALMHSRARQRQFFWTEPSFLGAVWCGCPQTSVGPAWSFAMQSP